MDDHQKWSSQRGVNWRRAEPSTATAGGRLKMTAAYLPQVRQTVHWGKSGITPLENFSLKIKALAC
jgi:hypothetical protein